MGNCRIELRPHWLVFFESIDVTSKSYWTRKSYVRELNSRIDSFDNWLNDRLIVSLPVECYRVHG